MRTGRQKQIAKKVVMPVLLVSTAVSRFAEHLESLERSPVTIRGYLMDLKHFQIYLLDVYNVPPYLEDISAQDLEEFLLALKNQRGLKPSSRRRYRNALRAFFSFCVKKGYLRMDLTAGLDPIRSQTSEREYLTGDEVAELVNAIRPRVIKTLVLTLFYTGLRISECVNLRLEHVDLEGKLIRVVRGKGNKDRTIPISERLHDILSDYLLRRKTVVTSDRFFAFEHSGKVSGSYVNQSIAEAVQRLGWKKNVSAHTLRHSFASSLVSHNVNLVHIQKLLGHSSLATTSVYTHTNLADMSEAVNTL